MKTSDVRRTLATAATARRTARSAQVPAKPWDPIRHLDEKSQAKLSPADRRDIARCMQEIHEYVRKNQLDHVPVFGYLSLPTANYKELGKASQADVVPGKDVVPAHLRGHDLGFIASTVFRGSDTRPGSVAGLEATPGRRTQGAVLRIPLSEKTEELLAVLLQREFFAESDLHDGRDAKGHPVSNAMYRLSLDTVHYDDRSVGRALVFKTNPYGAKALGAQSTFGDDDGLTAARLALFVTGEGGFSSPMGKGGGPGQEYWSKFHLEPRAQAGKEPHPLVKEAVDRASYLPPWPRLLEIAEQASHSPQAAELNDAALHVLEGAAVPIALHRDQKAPEALGLERTGQPGPDVSDARLLEGAVRYGRR